MLTTCERSIPAGEPFVTAAEPLVADADQQALLQDRLLLNPKLRMLASRCPNSLVDVPGGWLGGAFSGTSTRYQH